MSAFQLSKEETWSQHFGDDVTSNIDDVIFASKSSERYLFKGEELFVVDSSGTLTSTVSLGNNGNKNIYKGDNRQSSISAGCEFDQNNHLFISNGDVFRFDFGEQIWNNLGSLVC